MRDSFTAVFSSVSRSHFSATPVATPVVDSFDHESDHGQGDTRFPEKQYQSSPLERVQIELPSAWTIATRFLSFDGITSNDLFPGQGRGATDRRLKKTREVEKALNLLLSGNGDMAETCQNWNLAEWYMLEMQSHFLNEMLPSLMEPWKKPKTSSRVYNTLYDTMEQLGRIHRLYESRILEDIIPAIQERTQPYQGESRTETASYVMHRTTMVTVNFETKLGSLFLHSFMAPRLSHAISFVVHDLAGSFSQGVAPNPNDSRERSQRLFELLAAMQVIGLGDNFGQQALAYGLWKVMDDCVQGTMMKVDWISQNQRTLRLARWVNEAFKPLVQDAIRILGGKSDDASYLANLAVGRLGRLRIENLFDYVLHWDRSRGAILDIKDFITSPDSRLYLTVSFSEQVSRRLLHAGATTTHILNIYINIIQVFNELDPKGVLLDRVARPVRKYLRQREDTARIIVTSLLAELDEETGQPKDYNAEVSIEIAKEMSKPILGVDAQEDHDLNFDNMDWTPDPVDVSPDFRRSKSQDVTSALLCLYDREDFINELKTILGEHLLRNYDQHERFEREERLLELFKNRLGEDKLQACEVMLRDVQSSHLMNTVIHGHAAYQGKREESGGIDLNTHILSSFFWPSLKDDTFAVPQAIAILQKDYETSFEAMKANRKLRWLAALGRVGVELEFEDRNVQEEVPTWTATVIYAFQSETDQAVTKTISELELELEMEELLVRNAVAFWRSKQVLRELDRDTYTTVDTLSSLASTTASAATLAPHIDELPVPAVRSQQDLLNENAPLYKQFITGMLMNQGSLPAMRVFMMLKIMVPGGFNFGMEEVRGLLVEMVEEGKLVGQGDVYGIKRD